MLPLTMSMPVGAGDGDRRFCQFKHTLETPFAQDIFGAQNHIRILQQIFNWCCNWVKFSWFTQNFEDREKKLQRRKNTNLQNNRKKRRQQQKTIIPLASSFNECLVAFPFFHSINFIMAKNWVNVKIVTRMNSNIRSLTAKWNAFWFCLKMKSLTVSHASATLINISQSNETHHNSFWRNLFESNSSITRESHRIYQRSLFFFSMQKWSQCFLFKYTANSEEKNSNLIEPELIN